MDETESTGERLRELARTLSEAWERTTALQLGMGLSGLSLVVMLIGTCAAYSDDSPLPDPRPAPQPAEESAVTSYRFKEGFYHAQVDEDGDTYQLDRLSLEALKQPLPYALEYEGSRWLSVGRRLRTRSLKLRVIKKRLWVGEEGRGVRAPHLVLTISNRTEHHIAYRIDTGVRGKGKGKSVLDHNAIALKPKGRAFRTESLLRGSKSLQIKRVEVMQLTPIGYYYLSRLDPVRVQLDERSSQGHNFAELEPCQLLPWRVIRDGFATDEIAWRDVMDFYARHNCDEYTFFAGYRWSPDALERLPVKPPAQDP